MLLCSWEQSQPLRWCSTYPKRPIETMEKITTDLILLHHHSYRFFLIYGRLSSTAALRVIGQSAFEIRSQADIIYNQATRFIFEDAVDPGNGLHQPVALHGFDDIHGMKTRCIESGQPHIPDNGDLERIIRIFETLRYLFPTLFVSDMRLPVERV